MKEFNTLTKSEIKKVNKAGNGKIGEYYARRSLIDGFYNVTCSVFDDNFEYIVATVELSVCLFDRRRSWVHAVSGNVVD
jgi:hypothetical protein